MKRGSLIILFIIGLVGGRFLWSYLFFVPEKSIENGKITFIEANELVNKTVFLNGEWDFYSGDAPLSQVQEKNLWQTTRNNKNIEQGIYHLSMTLTEKKMVLALHFSSFSSKDKIFINNECVFDVLNEPTLNKMKRVGYFPYTVIYEKDEGVDNLDIVIQVSERLAHSTKKNVRGVRFGDAKKVMKSVNISNSSELLTSSIILLVGLASLGLYITVKRNRQYLYFGLALVLLSMILMLASGEKILQQLLSLPNGIRFSLMSSLVYLFCFTIIRLTDNHRLLTTKAWVNRFTTFLLIMSGVVLVVPSSVVFQLAILYKICGVLSIVIAVVGVEKSGIHNDKVSLFLIFSLLSGGNHLVWWIYYITSSITLPHYPFDLLLSIVCLLLAWFQNYKDLYGTMDHLNTSLIESSQSKKEMLTKATLRLNEPLNDMLSIIDHTLKKEEALYVKDDLIRLEGMNKEALILIENVMDITTDNVPLEESELTAVCLHDKIEYCCKMIKKEDKFASFIIELQLTRRDDYMIGDFKSFVQMIYQIFSVVHGSMTEGKIIFSDTRENDRIVLEVRLIECEMKESMLIDLNKTSQDTILNNGLFEDDLSVPIMRIKQLVDHQRGKFKIQQQKNDIVLCMDFQATEKPELQYDDYEYLKNYRLCLSNDTSDTKHSILVISNNIKQLIVLKELLTNEINNVYIAESFEEGLSYIKEYEVDLIVSDVLMSGITGYEGVASLRKEYNMIELPILLVATNKYKLELDAIYASGANDYIEKPIDGNELQIKVRTLLEMKESIASAIHYEASWLQAQIEPHFLFNTLNTIISLSTYDEEAMHEVLDAFMLLLHRKYKYSGGNDLITLKEELDLVESYLVIEKARFGDKIEVIWDVDSKVNLERVHILALTMQPLVENAIKHGILPLEGKGVLTVIIKENQKGIVEVRILDNGLGTTLTLEEILSKKTTNSSGIGLRNTYHRLKKIMGIPLTFHSEQNQGTELIFHLKAEVGDR